MTARLLSLKITATIVILLFATFLQAQTKLNCSDVHEGIFYNYPKNSPDKYVDIREGDYVRERNLVTGDTSLWKMKWNDDCTCTMSLVDMNGKLEQQTRDLIKKHKLVFAINRLTDDYYTYTGYLDKTSNAPLVTDTIWLHEKVNIVSNELFKRVPENEVFKKKVFNDTSAYALLYVYRPGKTTLSLASYLVYFDNNLMCIAQNNTGFLFKILKEGKFELKSRLNKDEASLPLNIQFGKTYFVKTMLQWGMYKHLSNYKLENKEMTKEEGFADFMGIKNF